MSEHRKKICMLAATPLTIHFFLKPHLVALAKEHDVTLMVNLNNDQYLPPLELPVTIIDIPMARKMAPFSDLRCLIRLVGLFRETKYDLLITVVPKAGLLGMLAGAFLVIPRRLHIFQGEVWANLEGFKRKLLHNCDWITASLATNVLAVSASERSFLIEQKVVSPQKIKVLGAGSIGGVDLQRFLPDIKKREQVRAELGIPSDAMVMIFIGRLAVDKGIHELIGAFHELAQNYQHLWLLLVGPDEESEMQKVELGQIANRVKRLPYTKEPESYLATADFLCLPSHREGFGVVIIEAAAMGLPAIASNIYGISDAVIDGETGLLFECGNIVALKSCMESLLADNSLRKTLGLNARVNVEQYFSDQVVVGNYVDYINHLLISSIRVSS
jgi:glycosyltransferase involved in cell wall biosynthesis